MLRKKSQNLITLISYQHKTERALRVFVCVQTKQEECHKTFSVGRCFSGGLQAQRQDETQARPVGGCAISHQTSGTPLRRPSPECFSFLAICAVCVSVIASTHIIASLLLSGNSRTKAGGECVRHRGISKPGRPRQSCFSAPTQC